MSSDFILQIIFWRNTVDVYTISHKENLVVNPNLQIMSNKFLWILSNLLFLLGITLFYKCHDTFWKILQSYVQLHCPNNRYWTYITIYPLQCYNNGTFIESIYFFTSVLGSLCHKRNYISIPWKNTRLYCLKRFNFYARQTLCIPIKPQIWRCTNMVTALHKYNYLRFLLWF